MNDTVRRVLTTLVILGCIALLAVAVQHTRRGDTEDAAVTGAPKTIVELLAPTPESSVLSQAQVLVDLRVDYRATLTINSVRIPDDQTVYRPELGQVSFTPGPGKVIERLPADRNCVEADISRVDGTAESVPPARWCFNVT